MELSEYQEIVRQNEAHPDYAEYKRRQREHIQALADKEGITHDEYIDRFEKWHREEGGWFMETLTSTKDQEALKIEETTNIKE